MANRVVIRNGKFQSSSSTRSEVGRETRTEHVGKAHRIVAFGIAADLEVHQRREKDVEISIHGAENGASRIITQNILGTLFVYQGGLSLSMFTSLISGNSVSVSGNGNTIISSTGSDTGMDITLSVPIGTPLHAFGISGSVKTGAA